MTENFPIRIRKATEADVNFIFNSWLKSYRDSALARSITDTIYFNEHHKVIEDILKTCEVLVACNNSNPGEIYGYCVFEQVDGFFVTHFAYVKHTFRNLGIAGSLFKEAGADFTKASLLSHCTKNSEKYIEKYNLVHSPYLALSKNYRTKVEKSNESNSN